MYNKYVKNILFKIITIFLLFNLINIINNFINDDNNRNKIIKIGFLKKFVIFIRKNKLSTGGLMAYYFCNIGCVQHYILKGYIPIIDLISHPNIFNGFNTSITKNPWEEFFNQPFNYTLDNVKKNAHNIKYVECYGVSNGPAFNILYNNIIRKYWHNVAKKYVPIKSGLIEEANYKFKHLFNNSTNVLGVLIRGTDYIAKKPHNHEIQPNPEIVLKDITKMEYKNKYDWIFITTEDDLIREKFISKLGKKLKYIKSKININYDYKKKKLLAFNKNINGNLEYMKTYLINIVILSKCLDIMTSKTAGTIVAFILTKGFRNKIIYNLGRYK